MKPSDALRLNREEIRKIVESHKGKNPRVFGSVMRGEDNEGSDIDILIDPTSETTLFDIAAIHIELEKLLGVPVDIVTPNGLPDKWRGLVISEAIPI